MNKRAVIKLSGEALAGDKLHGYCDTVLGSLSLQLKAVLDGGMQLAIVIGGGNYWRGAGKVSMDRVRADQMGMLATVMNAVYISEFFKKSGIATAIMTPMPFANITAVYDKDTAIARMDTGYVTIHAAGLCHPYFTTDSVTALRAAELQADFVLFAKNGVGGVYDKSPAEHSDARMYKRLSYESAIRSQLQFVDTTALNILKEEGIPSFVFNMDEPDSFVRACFEEKKTFGTILDNNLEEEYYVNPH